MTMTETSARPQIIEPTGPCDFRKPVTIRWDPMGTPEVKGWWLCVGTADAKEGDWNICSEDFELSTEKIFDFSNQPDLQGIRIQLLCMVPDNNLKDGDRSAMVLDPMLIENDYGKDML